MEKIRLSNYLLCSDFRDFGFDVINLYDKDIPHELFQRLIELHPVIKQLRKDIKFLKSNPNSIL